MSYHGYPNWPPPWTTTRKDKNNRPWGEVGILKQALMHELIPNKCYLVMGYDTQSYMGCLIFDDDAFCKQLHLFLQDYLDRPIKEIGDLDLSHTL
jgi:hypothetical protein